MGKSMVTKVVVSLVVVGALGVLVGRLWGSSPSASPLTTSTLVPVAQPDTAIWPFVSSTTRYAEPVRAAQEFATIYLGFLNPIVGSFQQGDSRSGEVPVRSTPTGPITTILVRRLTTTNSWWVLGASCADIQVTAPTTSEAISSPVTLRGRSTAYEAVVNVDFRQDGSLAPLKVTTVMGGSMGVMRPFTTSVSFPRSSTSQGALLFRTRSAKDEHVIEASVIRISYQR